MTFAPSTCDTKAQLFTAADRMRLLAIDIVASAQGTRQPVDLVHSGVVQRGEAILLAFMVEQEAYLADPALDARLEALNPWANRITFADPEVR